MKYRRAAFAALLYLKRCNDELLVLDGDTHALLAFVPEEERIKYSAMTGQSLFYMGETNLKHKVLAICEGEGASRAAYALKLLQSDGELTIASTGKDAQTGNLVHATARHGATRKTKSGAARRPVME